MPDCSQGEVWWAELPAPANRRPVLILTRSGAIPHLLNVTVAPLTRTIRGIESEVALSPAHGVPTACCVSTDNILTIPKAILDRRITSLDEETMADVFQAVRFVFDMPST